MSTVPKPNAKKPTNQLPKGLTSPQAKERLQTYGPNTIAEAHQHIWLKFLSYFWGPIPWMIEVAAILSAALMRWPDLIMIVAMLLINALLGFAQEYKADNAVALLKKKLALNARVYRDEKWQDIAASQLVPGDIIAIKLGNIVPADAKLLSGDYLSVDQAALTGESLPVDKKIGDTVYSGAIAKQGEMVAEVTETGTNTYFGKTAQLVKSAKQRSHFQQTILKIGNFLIFSTLAICLLIIVVAWFKHDPIWNTILFALILTVAAIPIALPAVMSVTMAIGSAKLAKVNAIVSKLVCVEELAGVDILCSDKTGTLTQNKLTAGELILFNNTQPDQLMRTAALACNPDNPDAIDQAILERFGKTTALHDIQVKQFLPFDPISKRIEVTLEDNHSRTFKVTKGAPQVIAALCQEQNDDITEQVNQLAKKGFRTLAVAIQQDGQPWKILGLIPLFDPPRIDCAQTIQELNQLGVSVKMVTGDHNAIAKETAKTLGMGQCIVSATTLLDQSSTAQSALLGQIEHADGFSEVFPSHKFTIVQDLQNRGHIVGMTGDGVNDAPALKQADVGIAVSGATDAARSSADLVLTEPGLSIITHAIKESRCIFGRMKSYAMYRISETVRLLLFLAISMIAFNHYPLTAIMIVLIALLNDIPIMMIAYDNMKPASKPTRWDLGEVITVSVGLAIIGVIATFGLYWLALYHWQMPWGQIKTVVFIGLLVGGNLTIYLTRNEGWLFTKPFPAPKFLIATLATQIAGVLIGVYGWLVEPIGWHYGILIIAYLLVWFVICMFVKKLLYHLLKAPFHKHHLFDKFSESLH